MKQSKAAIFVLLAGALWGSMGLFVRRLNAAGLYAMDVVLARMLSALLFMGVFMLLSRARASVSASKTSGAFWARAL